MAAKPKPHGVDVRPEADDQIGATPLSKNWAPEVDTAFKGAVERKAQVRPEKIDLDEIYQGMLGLLVPHEEARAAYLDAFGGDAAQAIDQLVEDLTAFQRQKAKHPYSSISARIKLKPEGFR